MPFPRNWVEELAIEWLTIEGYLTESNVRLKAGARGGVPEADVVGARVKGETLEVMHIETGSLAGNLGKNLKEVSNKFQDTKVTVVEDIFRDKLAWDGKVDYRPMYIASYCSRPEELRNELQKQKIEFLRLEEFITEKVFKAIDYWKRKETKAERRKIEKTMTLSECYWLLNLLDFLRIKGVLEGR